MNERMLELYRQAQVPDTAIDPSNNMPYETTRFSADKFAELIVQRTLDIVEAHTEIFQSDEAKAMVKHIKHSVKTDFGIK